MEAVPVNPNPMLETALPECACPSHYTWDILNSEFRIPAKRLFKEVFGERVNRWSNVHKRCGTNGLFMADWVPDETSDFWKRNLVYSPVINLPNGMILIFC